MSTIAIPTTKAKKASSHPVENKEDRTHILTERLKATLEAYETGDVYTVDPANHREGFKQLLKSRKKS